MKQPSQSNVTDHTPRQGATIDTRYIVWLRTTLILLLVVVLALGYLLSASFRSEVNRAVEILGRGDVAGLRDYILSFGIWAPVVSALLMILQALAAPLPGFLLAFANGLAFGAFWGGMLSFVSAALAATISFWLARALGRPPVEALVGKVGLEQTDRWFARWGTYTVLIARLVPIISFDIISYAAGLTPMRFRNFLGATLLGMAPATFLYAYLGEQAPQYVWVLLVAFGVVIVGAAILAVVRRWNRGRTVS